MRRRGAPRVFPQWTNAKEVERASKDLAAVQSKRADIATKIASKSKSLSTHEERQAKEDAKARTKVAEEQKRLIREREAHERLVTNEIRSRTMTVHGRPADSGQEEHDFFISHASEDKEGFVRDLAEALRAKGAKVWYDEFTLKVGDGLRRTIDRGLAGSRFGVVVLSEHFFIKHLPAVSGRP